MLATMRVRIRKVPVERDIDGVSLGSFVPGTVREVSASVGSWLIAEGYAEPEMRSPRGETRQYSGVDQRPADDRPTPRRRRTDT
jgi:hypothetical protein